MHRISLSLHLSEAGLELGTEVKIKIVEEHIVINWNPSIYNIIGWFAGTPGQKTHWPSVWCFKHYFFFIISYILRVLKTLYFHFCKIVKKNKNKLKQFAKNFVRNYKKKMILGTSDAWSMIHLSHQPSNRAWIYLDWRIS